MKLRFDLHLRKPAGLQDIRAVLTEAYNSTRGLRELSAIDTARSRQLAMEIERSGEMFAKLARTFELQKISFHQELTALQDNRVMRQGFGSEALPHH